MRGTDQAQIFDLGSIHVMDERFKQYIVELPEYSVNDIVMVNLLHTYDPGATGTIINLSNNPFIKKVEIQFDDGRKEWRYIQCLIPLPK